MIASSGFLWKHVSLSILQTGQRIISLPIHFKENLSMMKSLTGQSKICQPKESGKFSSFFFANGGRYWIYQRCRQINRSHDNALSLYIYYIYICETERWKWDKQKRLLLAKSWRLWVARLETVSQNLSYGLFHVGFCQQAVNIRHFVNYWSRNNTIIYIYIIQRIIDAKRWYDYD